MPKLTGYNHTWSAPMTDMQRERSSAPFERAPHGAGFALAVLTWLVGAAAVFGITCLSAWWTS